MSLSTNMNRVRMAALPSSMLKCLILGAEARTAPTVSVQFPDTPWHTHYMAILCGGRTVAGKQRRRKWHLEQRWFSSCLQKEGTQTRRAKSLSGERTQEDSHILLPQGARGSAPPGQQRECAEVQPDTQVSTRLHASRHPNF